MQQVTSYKTDDGKLFETKAEARMHNASISFTNWYEKHIMWSGGEPVYPSSILEWLEENAVEVMQHINLMLKYKGYAAPSPEQQEEYAQKYKEYDETDHLDGSDVSTQ